MIFTVTRAIALNLTPCYYRRARMQRKQISAEIWGPFFIRVCIRRVCIRIWSSWTRVSNTTEPVWVYTCPGLFMWSATWRCYPMACTVQRNNFRSNVLTLLNQTLIQKLMNQGLVQTFLSQTSIQELLKISSGVLSLNSGIAFCLYTFAHRNFNLYSWTFSSSTCFRSAHVFFCLRMFHFNAVQYASNIDHSENNAHALARLDGAVESACVQHHFVVDELPVLFHNFARTTSVR